MKLYRYSVIRESVADEWGGHAYTNVRLYMVSFDVVKETPCGFWISTLFSNRRWVSKTSRKRFAHPSPAEALEAFKRRKEAHVEHCRRRLHNAEEELFIAEREVP